ncbi:MAG: PAS domain S-box protein, partial [Fidelibacterota bacterium]
GKRIEDFVHPDYREMATGRVWSVLEKRMDTPPMQEKFIRLDGTTVFVEVETVPMEYEGQPAALLIARDITRRMMATLALKESAASLESVIASMPDPLLIVSPDFTIERASPATSNLLGYTAEELTGMPVGKIFQPEDELFSEGLLTRVRPKLQLLYDRDPEDFWSLLKTGPLAVVVVGSDGKIVMVNKEAEEVFGYTNDEVVGKTVDLLLPQKLRDLHEKERQWFMAGPSPRYMGKGRILKGKRKDQTLVELEVGLIPVEIDERVHVVGVVRCRENRKEWDFIKLTPFGRLFAEEEVFWNVEKTMVARDGNQVPVLVSGSVVRDTAGEVQRIILVARDITKRRTAEMALRESERQYRELLELTPDGIAVHSEGKIVFMNRAAARIMGSDSQEDFLGKPAIDFVHPDYRSMVLERIRRVLDTGEQAPFIEEKFLRRDGSVVDVEVTAMPFKYRDKPASLVIFRDLTERKEAERKERIHVERMQALHQASQALVTSLNFREVADRCAHAAREVIGADGAAIFLVDDTGTYLEPIVLKEPYSEFMAMRLRMGEGLSGRVAESGKAEIVNRVDLTGRGKQIPGTPVEPESLLSAPLRVKDRVIGVITLRRLGEKEFAGEDLELLENLANIAASSIGNARLFQSLQESEEESRTLIETAPDPIIVIDEASRVVEWNDGAERVFGFTGEEMVGQSLESISTSAGAWKHHGAELRTFLKTGKSAYVGVPVEVRAKRKDGRIIDTLISISARKTG